MTQVALEHHSLIVFFFQAEDGIRDSSVTGVQTCALPICRQGRELRWNSVCPGADVPLRVLVVDDHPMWRHSVAASLEDAGCSVAGTAGDGAQALRVARATRPQVVLLDLHLPDLSGAEFIPRLLAADPSARIVVLSASGERQDCLAPTTAGDT